MRLLRAKTMLCISLTTCCCCSSFSTACGNQEGLCPACCRGSHTLLSLETSALEGRQLEVGCTLFMCRRRNCRGIVKVVGSTACSDCLDCPIIQQWPGWQQMCKSEPSKNEWFKQSYSIGSSTGDTRLDSLSSLTPLSFIQCYKGCNDVNNILPFFTQQLLCRWLQLLKTPG